MKTYKLENFYLTDKESKVKLKSQEFHLLFDHGKDKKSYCLYSFYTINDY